MKPPDAIKVLVLFGESVTMAEILTEKDEEIERLRELSQRLEEAEYGMVAGNGAHDPITWGCADGWFRYIRTGKKRTDERT